MQITIDTEKDGSEKLRAVAAFALILAGDIPLPALKNDEFDAHPNMSPRPPSHSSMFTGFAEQTAKLTPSVRIHAPGIPDLDVKVLQGYSSSEPFESAPAVPSIPAPSVPSQVTPIVSAQVVSDPRDNPFRGHSDATPQYPPPFIPNNNVPVVFTNAPNAASAASVIPASAPSNSAPATFPPPFVPTVPTQASPAPILPFPANAPNASISAGAPQVPQQQQTSFVELDSAGLPWDARIHNKGRTKKKDGTWKLQKGLDPTFAQAVVQELIQKKSQAAALPPAAGIIAGGYASSIPPLPLPVGSGPLPPDMMNLRLVGTGAPTDPSAEARAAFASIPRPPVTDLPLVTPTWPTVPLPSAGFGALPVPPLPDAAPAQGMPAQQIPAPVFVPAAEPSVSQPSVSAAVGSVSAVIPSAYKTLIDKLTAATQNKTLNPAIVTPTVQRFGVANMGVLSDPQYAAMLPAISQEFDRLIAAPSERP